MIPEPLGQFVSVRLLPETAKSSALLVQARPDTVRRAEVLAVGPDVLDAQAGRTYLVAHMQGTAVGDDVVLLPESALLAEVTP